MFCTHTIGQIFFTNASTLTTGSTMTVEQAGSGAQTYQIKLCSDGATCGGGNVYLTCTAGATCTAAATGRVDACTVTKAAVPSGTTLTWNITVACGSANPAVNVCENHSTP